MYFKALNTNFNFITSKKWRIPRKLENNMTTLKKIQNLKFVCMGAILTKLIIIYMYLGAESEVQLCHLKIEVSENISFSGLYYGYNVQTAYYHGQLKDFKHFFVDSFFFSW